MMKPEIFQYSAGYCYPEYAAMCDRFANMQFPFLHGLKPQLLLADYIFSISMDRMTFGTKSTLRRFLGSFFRYRYHCEAVKENGTFFVFTLDEIGRPDYMQGLRKVAAQCEGSGIIRIDRTKPRLSFKRLLAPFQILAYARKLYPVVKSKNICVDMGVYLYRAKCDGQDLYRLVKKVHPSRVVTFCDFTPIETTLTQLLGRDGVPTATLQHGNGDNIFYGSCSDFYLANSLLSKNNLMRCGVKEDKIVVCGPMKYAGMKLNYDPQPRLRKVGVVFDGAKNLENNIEMIDVVHEAMTGLDARCLIRFHPNNKKEEYKGHVLPSDQICESLSDFEREVDLCIVYNSSMYTDMIYKRIPVIRYKNGNVDLFPEIRDRGFSNAEELRRVLQDFTADHERLIRNQDEIYLQVFGEHCGADTYGWFFRQWNEPD